MRRFSEVQALCVSFAALGGCGGQGDPVALPLARQASVVFVNAIPGANSFLLATNGSVAGAPQSFGTVASQCTSVSPGVTALSIGIPNSAGTNLTNSVVTSSVDLAAGGNVAVVAAGTTNNPRLLVVPTIAVTPLAVGIANVSVVNATPTGNLDVFLTSPNATSTSPTATSLNSFSAGTFRAVPVGNTSLVVRTTGTSTPAFTTSGLGLASGRSTTVLLIPGAAGSGFQALTVNGGC